MIGVAILMLLISGCVGTIRAAPAAPGAPQSSDTEPLAPLSAPAAQGSPLLHFDPSSAEVTVGSVTAVQVRLENVNNLYGIELHLAFDADLLQVKDDDAGREGVQITPGEIPQPEFLVVNNVDNGAGRIDYAVVQLAPRPPASGSGVVATIHFRAMAPGHSPLRFVEVKLATPEGFEIPVTLREGTVVVIGAPGPTATPTPTSESPMPTATPTREPEGPTPTLLPTVAPTQTPSPPSTPPSASAKCSTLYLVRSGDTVFSIARRFGISVDALAATNGLSPSFYIQIGQLLTIPGVAGPIATSHTVQAGETLYSIARRYRVSVETLAALNHLPHPWHVRQGQRLLICRQ